MICKNCGANVGENDIVCQFCHSQIEKPQPQNVTINNYYYDNSAQNGQPGYYGQPPIFKQEDAYFKRSPKDKFTALMLCLIFGLLGAHQFYAGKYGMGVVYFFTLGVLGFGWIIDIILIASGRFKDKNGLPIE